MPQDSEALGETITIKTAKPPSAVQPPRIDELVPSSFPAVVLVVVVVMILIFLLFHNNPSYYRAWIA